ncbi:MAG: RecQ family ATP-dependent DNA helicase [Gammaproteobacteria bacterium]|nr:RecQ family ATP-dependent DNA helicase [Gammaproteobacteria bacterium]
MQNDLVNAAINGDPLLGILPTGGGKSLCFQLPALVRNIRNASLTIVISPLQALMKDQVDNLKDKVGIESVAAIYGMLTMPERSAVLEAVRMGNISILYLSPEQLRNRSVKKVIISRQIGAWVFDEAHCLSKWGHDFRPDYLYCAKVIARITEQQNELPPPVFCYTATAKMDVIEDICEHFKQTLNIDLLRFEGGVERDNLIYEVVETTAHSKVAQVLQLLETYFSNDQPGSCVIFCATKKNVEQLAGDLQSAQDLPVSYFHAGLDSSSKRRILEDFIAGNYRVICATNAFGMGIDKDDVRLVIHFDIPGSLENYLQEAGRAGRDRESAKCILLFDQQDIEKQFKLTRLSEIRIKDIAEILKEIRLRAKDTQGRVVATSKELLRTELMNTDISVDDVMADTKVKTAIAWLEREGFLQREDNVNSVFQGKPLFANLQEADQKLEPLQLSNTARQQWLQILQALMNAKADEGINADDILDTVVANVKDQQQKKLLTPQRIMEILAQMASCGLVSRGFVMTAWLCPKGRDNCRLVFHAINEIENKLLEILPELEPDDDPGIVHQVDIRALNSKLKNDYELINSSPRIIRHLLKNWSEDGKLSGNSGSINLTISAREYYAVQLNRSWILIKKIASQRQEITAKVIDFLYSKLSSEQQAIQKKVMIEFSLEEAIETLQNDLLIQTQLVDRSKIQQYEFLLKGIERALLFLDSHKAIELQNGMAVFKQAMELIVAQKNTARYSRKHYRPLDDHYHQKVVQVHVMSEYARLGLEQIKVAIHLVKDYFEMLNGPFIGTYFKNRKSILQRATSQESWNRIVIALHNHYQQAIVHARSDQNQLVLAGPGAGKSKVIIHRVAYLLRVEQVPESKILVLSFNHNSAVSLHKRLIELLGRDARFIRVYTFHGLALRLLGQTPDPEQMEAQMGKSGFDCLLEEAINLLKGNTHELGLDTFHQRIALLDGLEHILVDEYQDIDQLQYEMIAALAGQSLEEDEKLSLMAVGDDDQSIYQFRNANVKYIHQFKQDYQAKIHYLTQNYRSTRNIIAAANSLIAHNQDRMKLHHAIKINDARLMELPGGKWQTRDSIHQGRVKIVQCRDADQQANEVLVQILAIKALDPEVDIADIAVLARNGIEKHELLRVRSVLHQANIPYRYSVSREDSFPLHSVREFIQFKNWLSTDQQAMLSTRQMLEWLQAKKNHWYRLIEQIIFDWQVQFGDEALITDHFVKQLNDYFFEQKRQTRYGSGVLLSTVHGVKGEEFKHVIILDGGWNFNSQDRAYIEEERRLYYVAMTRAIEQLILMQQSGVKNPHIALLSNDYCSTCWSNAENRVAQLRRFSITGLRQIYLSYAAKKNAQQPINKTLENLHPGDSIRFATDQEGRIVMQYEHITIAKLSQQGQENYAALLHSNYQATIIAMILRNTDPENTYDQSNKVAEWWVPVVEVMIL